jgi:glycerol-3-phosphate dehydrogenase
MGRQHEDKMTTRLEPVQGASGFPPAHLQEYQAGGGDSVPFRTGRPEFRIEIKAADGITDLLVLREQNGYLVVEGDEAHWPEATLRFLQQMRQWSGQVGLRWQDEVQKAAGDQP